MVIKKPILAVGHYLPKYSKLIFSALTSPTLIFFVLLGNFVMISCLVIFFHFEHGINPTVNDWTDAIWWAFTTVSTVGYGDIVPFTVGGRVASVILMVWGVTFFVGFTSLWVTSFVNKESKGIVEESIDVARLNADLLDSIQNLQQKIDRLEKRMDQK